MAGSETLSDKTTPAQSPPRPWAWRAVAVGVLLAACSLGEGDKADPADGDTSPVDSAEGECGGLYVYESFNEWLEAVVPSLCGAFLRCLNVPVGVHDMEDCVGAFIRDYPHECHWDRVDPCDAALCAAEWVPSEAELQETDPECNYGQQIPVSCTPVFRALACEDSTPADGGE